MARPLGVLAAALIVSTLSASIALQCIDDSYTGTSMPISAASQTSEGDSCFSCVMSVPIGGPISVIVTLGPFPGSVADCLAHISSICPTAAGAVGTCCDSGDACNSLPQGPAGSTSSPPPVISSPPPQAPSPSPDPSGPGRLGCLQYVLGPSFSGLPTDPGVRTMRGNSCWSYSVASCGGETCIYMAFGGAAPLDLASCSSFLLGQVNRTLSSACGGADGMATCNVSGSCCDSADKCNVVPNPAAGNILHGGGGQSISPQHSPAPNPSPSPSPSTGPPGPGQLNCLRYILGPTFSGVPSDPGPSSVHGDSCWSFSVASCVDETCVFMSFGGAFSGEKASCTSYLMGELNSTMRNACIQAGDMARCNVSGSCCDSADTCNIIPDPATGNIITIGGGGPSQSSPAPSPSPAIQLSPSPSPSPATQPSPSPSPSTLPSPSSSPVPSPSPSPSLSLDIPGSYNVSVTVYTKRYFAGKSKTYYFTFASKTASASFQVDGFAKRGYTEDVQQALPETEERSQLQDIQPWQC